VDDFLSRVLIAGRPLSQADVERLEQLLLPPWRVRQLRLARRNAALFEVALAMQPNMPTLVAKQIAAVLRRYLEAGWKRECDMPSLPAGEGALRVALHQLAKENGGRPLSWQHIYSLLIVSEISNGDPNGDAGEGEHGDVDRNPNGLGPRPAADETGRACRGTDTD